MALFLIRHFKEGNVVGIEEALRIRRLVRTPNDEIKAFVNENSDFVDSLAWILSCSSERDMRFEVIFVLKMAIDVATSSGTERLRLEMFMNITKKVLGERKLELTKLERHTIKIIINLLAHLCSCADGRAKLLQHACGIAKVSEKILRVSEATDDRAIYILSLGEKKEEEEEIKRGRLDCGVVELI
ncbi:hypothetical protein G4B88_014466 [Cannabis sativa]|uniref:U-box domain-containing protein n=1 Tax=Cannabis sativa TaxID=3483 RepID=A0A7J6IBJ2_CANSA|nr:hypothetical protein G4B88_014466 [Cannabis sativa]